MKKEDITIKITYKEDGKSFEEIIKDTIKKGSLINNYVLLQNQAERSKNGSQQ